MGLLQVKSYAVAKRPPVGVAWKFKERVPARVSSLSSDRGSKLRGLSQKSPRVASKQDANITKLERENTRIQRLINGIELGDLKPSRLLQKLRSVATLDVSENLIKDLWLGKPDFVMS
ncbi:hypothetical protein AVEN_234216-1 [Araneus ventricosus]|uniref:Uncharacterized protein n=1 Tax=Araneus ventricosus TaxID=182803 RepID=A0A4Y2A7Y6_ARAVE|nr:hypothetical protein AVEN_234216-1 [Araneus ventricosus]